MEVTLQQFRQTLDTRLAQRYNANERRHLFVQLCRHACGIEAAKALAFPETKITNIEYNTLMQWVERLFNHEPLQYIVGYEEFYGLKFVTNAHVLIPRPETEELVQWVLTDFGANWGGSVLDIGTGSGCIAVALAKNMGNASVSAIDLMPGAIEVARQNARDNAVEIAFMVADILNPVPFLLNQRFDVIVSNPPYIGESEQPLMAPNVLSFEPHTALFVPDTNVLLFYRAIARFAQQTLNKGGVLYFEINERYGTNVVDLLHDLGFSNPELRADINGKPRMVKAHWNRAD